MAWNTDQMCKIAAEEEIKTGYYINLGIGIPTAIANHVPLDREVIIHSENGLIGMGPAPEPDKVNRWLVNAGKQKVAEASGGDS